MSYLKRTLLEDLIWYRSEFPDKNKMDGFIKKAKLLQEELNILTTCCSTKCKPEFERTKKELIEAKAKIESLEKQLLANSFLRKIT